MSIMIEHNIFDNQGNLIRVEANIRRGNKKYWEGWWEYRKRVYLPNHPNADASGCLEVSTVKASTALGNPIPKGAEVHHYKDELVICQDLPYHRLLHARQRAYQGCGDVHKRKCTFCKQWDELQNLKTNKIGAFWHTRCASEYSRQYRRRDDKN